MNHPNRLKQISPSDRCLPTVRRTPKALLLKIEEYRYDLQVVQGECRVSTLIYGYCIHGNLIQEIVRRGIDGTSTAQVHGRSHILIPEGILEL